MESGESYRKCRYVSPHSQPEKSVVLKLQNKGTALNVSSSSDYSTHIDPPECWAKLTLAINAPNTLRNQLMCLLNISFFLRNRCFPIDFVICLTTVCTKCSVGRILRATQTRLTRKTKRPQARLDYRLTTTRYDDRITEMNKTLR